MRQVKYILTVIMWCFCVGFVSAQKHHFDTLGFKVYFKQNSSDFMLDYRNNAQNLYRFEKQLEKVLVDSLVSISYISISTGASPDGDEMTNERVSAARAVELSRFLTEYFSLPPNIVRTSSIGEDWSGLAEAVRGLDVSWRNQVLDIISTPYVRADRYGRIVDDREERLKRLNDKEVWNYLVRNVFPSLRSSAGYVTCYVDKASAPQAPKVVKETAYRIIKQTVRDTVYVKEPQKPAPEYVIVQRQVQKPTQKAVPAQKAVQKPAPEPQKPASKAPAKPKKEPVQRSKEPVFALGTNILAIPMINLGGQIPLGRHWSIGANCYYPWIFRRGNTMDCNQLFAIDAEGRYWFGNARKPEWGRLTGHSVGAYLGAGYYDFERGGAGHQGEFVNFGVDYKYALPVAKGRVHFEFEIGLGYIYSKAKPYTSVGGMLFTREHLFRDIRWMGPTRAQVSIVVPIYKKTGKKGK